MVRILPIIYTYLILNINNLEQKEYIIDPCDFYESGVCEIINIRLNISVVESL